MARGVQPLLLVDPSGPLAGKLAAQSLRLAGAVKGVVQHGLDQLERPQGSPEAQRVLVNSLPKKR